MCQEECGPKSEIWDFTPETQRKASYSFSDTAMTSDHWKLNQKEQRVPIQYIPYCICRVYNATHAYTTIRSSMCVAEADSWILIHSRWSEHRFARLTIDSFITSEITQIDFPQVHIWLNLSKL